MTTSAPTSASPNRPGRSRPRRYLPVGVAVWLALEIWLLTMLAGAVGGAAVALLLVAGAVLGAVVIKRAGRRAFQNLSQTLRGGGDAPSAGRGGNGLTMLGGLLLMIPGVLSDAAGLLLLLPPVQRVVGRYTRRTVDRRLRRVVPGSLGDAFQQARVRRPDGKVVQGEVIRDDRPGDAPREERPPLTR
ncbi:FxsA family membrane protein [Streptomyces sp. NPDC046985]|uniref:FxsA family membrane protein n=1 Tax=Streptomyces sp. NPDC046985 TaxID=3155377 RepID=UPI0033DF9E01